MTVFQLNCEIVELERQIALKRSEFLISRGWIHLPSFGPGCWAKDLNGTRYHVGETKALHLEDVEDHREEGKVA